MRFYFSKRHADALKSKKLVPYLSRKLRTAIRRTLNEYSTWGGYDQEENLTFEEVESLLKTFYGLDNLIAYDENGDLVPSNLYEVIETGAPARVLDIIEACSEKINQQTECEQELNSLFEIHNSPWRVVNATVVLIDSEYLHNEVIAKTQNLLQENSVFGALEEFTKAVSCLTESNTKDAVVYAHKSVESVMKTCLETKKHLTFGKLLEKLIKSGLIPEYYEEFLVHFEKLALGAVKERNLPGRGHGQGQEPTEVPKCLSEFAVHLAGTINLFILRRWIESRPEKAQPERPEFPDDDEVPF